MLHESVRGGYRACYMSLLQGASYMSLLQGMLHESVRGGYRACFPDFISKKIRNLVHLKFILVIF